MFALGTFRRFRRAFLAFLARFVSFPASPFLSFPLFRSTGVFDRSPSTLDVDDARRRRVLPL
jgi:hypothetical protein